VVSTQPSADDAFIRLDVRTLRADAPTRFALYLDNGAGDHVLYRAPDIVLTAPALEGLRANGVGFLWVPKSEQKAYLRYLEDNLASMCADPAIPLEQKCELVYEAAASATERLFVDDVTPEAVDRATSRIVRPMISVLGDDESAVTAYVSGLRSDGRAWTHAVNGCLLGILLLRKLHGGGDASALVEFGVAMLLRDIALRDAVPGWLAPGFVPSREERDVHHRHPLRALEILKDVPLSDGARAAIAQHHERPDGSGFPLRLRDAQIHRLGGIAAVVDAFVTIHARRPRGERQASFHSMRETLGALGGHVDPQIVINFVLLFAKENPMRRWAPRPRV
jgi:HD domain-containing protein